MGLVVTAKSTKKGRFIRVFMGFRPIYRMTSLIILVCTCFAFSRLLYPLLGLFITNIGINTHKGEVYNEHWSSYKGHKWIKRDVFT